MTFELVPNPAYEGRAPTPLEAACHDGSPFLTVRCGCGAEMHLHETQVAGAPADHEIGTACPECRELLVFPPGMFRDAFADMRREGWIA